MMMTGTAGCRVFTSCSSSRPDCPGIRMSESSTCGGSTPNSSWEMASVAEAITVLRRELQPGDVVLVKASRAIGLERVAQAILEEPSLLLLDDPMNGLDNYGVAEMRSLFQSLAKDGRTILLASHNIQDIEALCDTVCEMDAGVMTMIRETPLKEGANL